MFRGIMTPVVTPIAADGAIAHDVYVAHSRWVLDQGSHFVTPFGTNGEALSFGKRQRMAAIDALLAAGIEPSSIMPGTGLTALEDTADLTRHAMEVGCAAAMVLPPFFFRKASDEGLYRYFASLIETIGGTSPKLCLYHIPPVAGIGFSPALVARLKEAFPDVVVALKDSGGDWSNTRAYIDTVPDLDVFPGSEAFLLQGQREGAAGCISGSCNVNPAAIRAVFDKADQPEVEALNAEMLDVRRKVEGAGLMPACKWLLCDATGEATFGRVMPPLLPLSAADGQRLKADLAGRLSALNGHYAKVREIA